MTPERINAVIAEWRGWKRGDYDDLNAVHEAVLFLRSKDGKGYLRYQQNLIRQDGLFYTNATAPQRCEALLRTLGKWEE